MDTINEEFDAVIRIKKLDNYRLHPQKTAASPEALAARNSVSSNISSADFDSIEKMIYAVIENNKIGIKAKDIADKLLMSRSDVNHYLYSTLKRFVKIDKDYKWHIAKSFQDSSIGSTLLRQEKTHNDKTSILSKSMDYNLQRNENVAYYLRMFDKLVVSHRNGLNAPHKYILLISVFSLIGKGYISSNKFGSTKEIEEEFNKTWNRLVPRDVPFKSMYTTPFWHLASEPFWNIYTSDGSSIVDIGHKPIMSIKRQRKELSAIIDFKLYNIILDNEIRSAIIAHLESIVRKGLNLE